MTRAERINAFVALGDYLRQLSAHGQLSADELERLCRLAQSRNSWFTPSTVRFALKAWGEQLQEETLQQWLQPYDIPDAQPYPKKVGLIMPGNVPLEGFHDLLCVLLSGHLLRVRLHANDLLPKLLLQKLVALEPRFEEQFQLSEQLKAMDAYLAAADETTARNFEHYFRHKPHLIRRNRYSCAVLSGQETEAELKGLGRDMLQYWGFGSRSVLKLFVPRNYHFPTLFEALEIWSDVQNHHRWSNNYDYYKSILLVNGIPHLDTGFLLFREEATLKSPATMIHYQYYSDIPELERLLEQHSSELQCVVGPENMPANLRFGQAHRPVLTENTSGLDIISFLLNL